MEPITIEVEPEIARAYQVANDSDRQKMQIAFNTWFKQFINTRSLEAIMQQMSDKAEVNRLNQEILNEILKEPTSQTKLQPRVSGQDKGKIFIASDFNAPLPDNILADFMG